MSTFDFMQTLFPPGSVSPDISKEDFAKEFDRRIKQLEGSGFLTKNGLPKIEGEEELTRKLAFHASQKQMVMIKYWKRGCIPCLAKAEMFKEVEGWILDNNPGCAFYSVDIKDPVNYDLSERQLVDGTPAIQKYWNGRQVGGEVRVNDKASLIDNMMETLTSCQENRCPTNTEPEYQ